jgi:Rod binding domain-containing protein
METAATTNSATLNIIGGPVPVAKAVDEALKSPESANAWKAAKTVEGAFMGMLLKEMEKTVQKGSMFHGGMGEEIFQNELDNAYIKSFEQSSGNGIAQLYYEQLTRRRPADAAKAKSRLANGFIPLNTENPALPLGAQQTGFLPLNGDMLKPRFVPLRQGGF